MKTTQREALDALVYRLVVADRIEMPTSSIAQKARNIKENVRAELVDKDLIRNFEGERAYLQVGTTSVNPTTALHKGIAAFKEAHPKYGAKLEATIAAEKAREATVINFGLQEGRRVSHAYGLQLMSEMGYVGAKNEALYNSIRAASDTLARAKESRERSMLIG